MVKTRVVIFEDKDSIRLGKTINKWLEGRPGIKIKYILQTAEAERVTYYGRIVISIWYEGG